MNPSAERALRREHPWLFADSITSQSHAGQPGDLAVIFDSRRQFLAIGLYDPSSPIRVRVLQHHKPVRVDRLFFANKLNIAIQIRAGLPANTNGYRLAHGENDGLPGFVVDRYDQSLVIKLYSPAWIPYLSELVNILQELLAPKRIILRLGRQMMRMPEFLYQLEDGSVIYGTQPKKPVLFIENGITFEADLIHGQKTGFFLDQRDNRSRVEKIAKGKRVLNIFSYTGGFSVYAARGGASEVISVDSSQPALDAAQRNFAHNQNHPSVASCHHSIHVGDAFAFLKSYAHSEEKFDLVIIDPPSFAKNKSEIEKAASAYQRLTQLGISVLTRSGIFVQASCSSRISGEIFFEIIHQAAQLSGRPLKKSSARNMHSIIQLVSKRANT